MRRVVVAALSGAAAAAVVLAIVGSIIVAGARSDRTAPAPLQEAGLRDALETGAKVATAGPPTPSEPRLEAEPDVVTSTFETFPEKPGTLTARTVRSVAIGPDGKPILSATSQPATAVEAVAAPAPGGTPQPVIANSYTTDTGGLTLQLNADLPQKPPAAATAPIPQTRPADLGTSVATTTATSGDVRTVGGTGVNVRSGPSSSEPRMYSLAPGEEVTVLDRQRGWLQVRDEDGRTGWVYSDFVN